MNNSSNPIQDLPRLRVWVDEIQAKGKYTFTKEEASKATGLKDPTLRVYLGRLTKKGRLVMPRRGFFVIVPLEYQSQGAPPPSWFIDALMTHEGRGYYVGLLSAAALHGAGHQQPQEFQVMVESTRKPIRVGRHRIAFFVRAAADTMPHVEMKSPTGVMQVSNRAVTAMDLVLYYRHIGGMDHAATVIKELAEEMKPEEILRAAPKYDLAVLQRLGFLLEWTKADHLAMVLENELVQRVLPKTKLRPDLPKQGAVLSDRWALWINDSLEVIL